MKSIKYSSKKYIPAFGKLKFTEKRQLKKAIQEFLSRPSGIFDNAYFIIRKELKSVSKNFRSYKVLLAEFNYDETGSIVMPRSTRIITDDKDNIVYILKENGFKDMKTQNLSINYNGLFEFGAYNELFESNYTFEK